MRILKKLTLLKQVNSFLVDSAQPANLSYLWNFGSLLASCLIIQILTGVFLAMHYSPNIIEAFNSVEHIMRDVNSGWLIRYLHANTASAFFFLVYLHIGRGMYYGSFKAPRTLVWVIGTVIFILMMATAFLGYVLPYGQMSLWGATVITNLMSAIPWIGQDIVEFIWGGFSVNNATLNRFFALHFLLPFLIAALVLMHLIVLHDTAGSSNPLGISSNYDKIPFSPYFIFKDLITLFLFIFLLSMFVFFMPNVLGDSENYIMANPMQTPPAIVPEWYLLPFYAILRSIPNKLLGVIAMFSAILALLTLPFVDLSKLRGIQFRPLSKQLFYAFLANFGLLMILGGKHVENPYIELGQISTVFFFSYFIFVYLISLLFNSSLMLSLFNNTGKKAKNNLIYLEAGFIYTSKRYFSNSTVFNMNNNNDDDTPKAPVADPSEIRRIHQELLDKYPALNKKIEDSKIEYENKMDALNRYPEAKAKEIAEETLSQQDIDSISIVKEILDKNPSKLSDLSTNSEVESMDFSSRLERELSVVKESLDYDRRLIDKYETTSRCAYEGIKDLEDSFRELPKSELDDVKKIESNKEDKSNKDDNDNDDTGGIDYFGDLF